MKKHVILLSVVFVIAFSTAFVNKHKPDEKIYIERSEQRTGDSLKGYQYLTTGDFLKSGIPYTFFIMKNGKDTDNLLNRTGKNATVSPGYNVITTADSVDIVIPTCMQCHAQVFDRKLVIGLGNTFLDFSETRQVSPASLAMMQRMAPKQYSAGKILFRTYKTVFPQLAAEVRGVNVADRLASLLAAHLNPKTLVWSDTPLLNIPEQVVPTDVPPWWLLKKKNAMFYNGFGRGDFAKFLMASNLLTISDSSEATETDSHFGDVLAYIKTLQPPKYPYPIDEKEAAKGKNIFVDNCSECHGTYGSDGNYPNLLIAASVIGTDSLLYKANQQDKQFVDWFNNSWFSQGTRPARLEPFDGYIAPPLDGIWITAPYFHNGSVPTLEAVLDSRKRPAYWSRNFDNPEYDYKNIGWKYEIHDKPNGKKVYNTTLPGYGNYGHYFGDALSDMERKEVIEYLKTL